MKRIFVTGTGTDVGKTHIACRWLRRRIAETNPTDRRIGVYKPVASGCTRRGDDLHAADAEALWNAAGRPRTLDDVCPQRFIAPLAPYQSAATEGKQIDEPKLIRGIDAWQDHDEVLIEGAGGLLSPITANLLNIDLAIGLHVDQTILVTDNRIGVAHAVLSTLAAAAARDFRIDQIVLNQTTAATDDSAQTNQQLLQDFTDIPLEIVAFNDQSNSNF